jgi:hypothetical protein
MDVPKATPVAVGLDRADAAPLRGVAPFALSAEDVADAMSVISATYRRPDAAGVCVADGFGVKVAGAVPLVSACWCSTPTAPLRSPARRG